MEPRIDTRKTQIHSPIFVQHAAAAAAATSTTINNKRRKFSLVVKMLIDWT